MNKVNCEIIRDVLPLYTENIASDPTKRMVEEHVASCEECRNKLDLMKKELKIPADHSTNGMIRIKKQMGKKNVQIAIFSGLIVLVMAILMIIYLNSPISLGCNKDRIAIEPNMDGSVSITLGEEVAGYRVESLDDTGSSYDITCWNTLWNQYVSNAGTRTIVIKPQNTAKEIKQIYYYSEQTKESGDVLLYSSEEATRQVEGMVSLPRLVLNYYFIISMILTVIGGILCFVTRKRDKKRICLRITMIPLAYLLSSILVLRGKGDTYNSAFYFSSILMVSIVLYGVMYFVLRKIVNRRR